MSNKIKITRVCLFTHLGVFVEAAKCWRGAVFNSQLTNEMTCTVVKPEVSNRMELESDEDLIRFLTS